ncbi:MAG: hypothetical protein QG585_154 [Patescibacteria group bacterium]|jgi:hypothetical protein|nr:hypothetical protein [Patescibacteria group bacterium]
MISKRKFILILTLAFSSILLVSFLFTTKLHLFWSTPWIDVPNHFLGGLILGLVGFLVLGHHTRKISPRKKVTELLVFTLVIGGLWEVYEEVAGLTSLSDSVYWIDTIGDFIADALGALAGYYYFLKEN